MVYSSYLICCLCSFSPGCLCFSPTSALSDLLQSNCRPANNSGIKPTTIPDQKEKILSGKQDIENCFGFFNHCLYYYTAAPVPGSWISHDYRIRSGTKMANSETLCIDQLQSNEEEGRNRCRNI